VVFLFRVFGSPATFAGSKNDGDEEDDGYGSGDSDSEDGEYEDRVYTLSAVEHKTKQKVKATREEARAYDS
jgi:hypothetical protein